MHKTQRIYNYLRNGHTLTRINAVRLFNCYNIEEHITKIQDRGHNIVDTVNSEDNPQYKLVDENL